MATTTPNFGWSVPTSTDLVKDGATAIETLGDAIDASLVDLKGGTTGQVLAKNSNTDMDFVWTADASGIPASAFTAKGNLLVGTGSGTYVAQSVGSNGQVLTADSAEADGVKWATPAAGANWSLLNAGGTALTGATTITVSGISNADKIFVVISGASSANGGAVFSLRFNADSGANYNYWGFYSVVAGSYSSGNTEGSIYTSSSSIRMAKMGNDAVSTVNGGLLITGANAAGVKVFQGNAGGSAQTSSQTIETQNGFYSSSSTISSVSILSNSGNFDAGTIFVYTSA